MIALSGVGHLDLPSQDREVSVTPVQPEIVSLRCSSYVLFDSCAAEGQVGPAVEKLRDPARNFGGECAFIDWPWVAMGWVSRFMFTATW